jgi:PHD/YefM family antitoxin component YafN of YafNO toxin-antitoxin module
MLIGISEWDSLQQTIFLLSQPKILEDVAQAQ